MPTATASPRSDLDEPFGGRIPIPPVKPEQVLEWRKKYPLQSLAGRLKYEAARTPKSSPPLSNDAKEVLAERTRFPVFGSESMRLLHEEKVEEFVARSGFGVGRMMYNPRSPGNFEPEESKPIPLAKVPESSGHGPSLALPSTRAAAHGSARLMPTVKEMLELHVGGASMFTDWNAGYAKSVDAVAGFTSHRFLDHLTPPIDFAQPRPKPGAEHAHQNKYWMLTRLELTSLLKHDTPRVYLSEHLPRMEDLSSTRTRELTEFEAAALAKLQAGEEIVVAATVNRIEMLGALRAGKDCRQCHEVPQGTLLGAFSYDFRRDPPIKDLPKADAVQ